MQLLKGECISSIGTSLCQRIYGNLGVCVGVTKHNRVFFFFAVVACSSRYRKMAQINVIDTG